MADDIQITGHFPAPAILDHNGIAAPKAGFMDGTDGTPRLAWARYQMEGFLPREGASGYFAGGYSQYANTAHRNRGMAGAISTEFLVSNPTVRTIIDTLTVQACGSHGLTLSSKPVASVIGITETQARTLAHDIETKWKAWSGCAWECDSAGRSDLHELAAASFQNWLVTGEALTALDWRKSAQTETATKVSLLAPAMIDTRSQEGQTLNSFLGIAFDKKGRTFGAWMRRASLGSTVTSAPPLLVPFRTSWGRRKLLHQLEILQPGQIRGLSPIVAALTSAQERAMLQEIMVAGQALQNSFALTVESGLPKPDAIDKTFAVDDRASGAWDAEWADMRRDWYTRSKIQAEPGIVNHLAPGDSLKFNRPQAITSHYDAFESSLMRESARAAGAFVEDISGSWKDTSFSASRLALELPHRINLKRRHAIAERFYREVFACWLEEQIETGSIELPPGAKPFWQAKDAYVAGNFNGPGKASADPLKDAEALEKKLQLGLITLEDALAESGQDFEAVLAQRIYEKKRLTEAGLDGTPIYQANVQTREMDSEDQDDTPAKRNARNTRTA